MKTLPGRPQNNLDISAQFFTIKEVNPERSKQTEHLSMLSPVPSKEGMNATYTLGMPEGLFSSLELCQCSKHEAPREAKQPLRHLVAILSCVALFETSGRLVHVTILEKFLTVRNMKLHLFGRTSRIFSLSKQFRSDLHTCI